MKKGPILLLDSTIIILHFRGTNNIFVLEGRKMDQDSYTEKVLFFIESSIKKNSKIGKIRKFFN